MEGHNNEVKLKPLGRKRKNKKKNYKTVFNVTEPITSYGLILFSYENDELIFLLYQRRDNFEYMDFMRGTWTSSGQIPALFSAMSPEERRRIREYTFKELWDDLWVEHNCRIYRDGYTKAKKKYDMVKCNIPQFLDNTFSHIQAPPWGFPKGKKNNYLEDPIDCAFREFEEETHISIKDMRIVHDKPFTENFKGSNGKAYATHYFVAELPKPINSVFYSTPHCIRPQTISEEASNVKWFNYTEACNHLNTQRKGILDFVIKIIQDKSA